MIRNRRAYQLIQCRTHSRLLAGAAAVCAAVCGHADLGLYHLLHTGRPCCADSIVSKARGGGGMPAAAAAGPGDDAFGHRAGV